MWGIVALVAWGIAILSANLSGLVPAHVFAALHASRLDGGTINQVRSQIAALEAEAAAIRRENSQLLQRFDLAEQARSEVTKRVGALEVSVPRLIERLPREVAIDGSVTASIVDGRPLTFDAEGGSVTVEQKPLVSIATSNAFEAAKPADPVADGSAFGVALGFPISPDDAEAQWQGLLAKVGTLLIGLWPVLAEGTAGEGKQLVAGPLETQSQAAELCERMGKVGIPCVPMSFKGEPLPLLN